MQNPTIPAIPALPSAKMFSDESRKNQPYSVERSAGRGGGLNSMKLLGPIITNSVKHFGKVLPKRKQITTPNTQKISQKHIIPNFKNFPNNQKINNSMQQNFGSATQSSNANVHSTLRTEQHTAKVEQEDDQQHTLVGGKIARKKSKAFQKKESISLTKKIDYFSIKDHKEQYNSNGQQSKRTKSKGVEMQQTKQQLYSKQETPKMGSDMCATPVIQNSPPQTEVRSFAHVLQQQKSAHISSERVKELPSTGQIKQDAFGKKGSGPTSIQTMYMQVNGSKQPLRTHFHQNKRQSIQIMKKSRQQETIEQMTGRNTPPSSERKMKQELDKKDNLPASMRHLVNQLNSNNGASQNAQQSSSKAIVNITGEKDKERIAKNFNKLMKKVQGLNEIVEGPKQNSETTQPPKMKPTHRYSQIQEQKKRNLAYLNEENQQEILKSSKIFEALPNQLIQQNKEDPPQNRKKQRRERANRSKKQKQPPAVLTTFIDLNNKKKKVAETAKDRSENQVHPTNFDEASQQYLLVNDIGKFGYQSQSKTEASQKEDQLSAAANCNIDTGKTIKQVAEQFSLQQNNQIDTIEFKLASKYELIGNQQNQQLQGNISPQRQYDHRSITSRHADKQPFNDVSSFEPVEISNKMIKKQKQPDSMKMPINDFDIHDSIFNNYSALTRAKQIADVRNPFVDPINFDSDHNIKTERVKKTTQKIDKHQKSQEEEGSLYQNVNKNMIIQEFHQSELGRMIDLKIGNRNRLRKTDMNFKSKELKRDDSLQKQNMNQYRNSQKKSLKSADKSNRSSNNIDSISRNEKTIQQQVNDRTQLVLDEQHSLLSMTKHQALFHAGLPTNEDILANDQNSTSQNPFTNKHSEVKQEQPVQLSPLKINQLFKNKRQQDETGANNGGGLCTTRIYTKNKLMKPSQMQHTVREHHNISNVADETLRLSLRLSNLKEISPRVFENNSSLIEIDLRNNRLTTLPDQICDQVSLQDLKLDYNFLYVLPTRINRLTKLHYLSISQNNLRQLPQSLMQLSPNLKTLILNDNKLSQISHKIGNLTNLNTLLLHNNFLKDLPSTLYRLHRLQHFSLDWFCYLNTDFLTINTKILKIDPLFQAITTNEDNKSDDGDQHRMVLNNFLNFCKINHINEFKKLIEKRQQEQHKNPQQDDSEPVSRIQINFNDFIQKEMSQNIIPASMTKGVTNRNRINNLKQHFDKRRTVYDENDAIEKDHYDPLQYNKSVSISFVKFLMYFYHVSDFEMLILKSIFPSKQRKLSHLIALNGHPYLMKDIIKQLQSYVHNCSGMQKNQIQNSSFNDNQNQVQQSKFNQTEYQFLNSIDRDFSTPIILALRNQKNMITNLLLKQPKICLTQQSMKYGTALHVSLSNNDFRLSYKIAKNLVKVKDFDPVKDFNRADYDGNTPLHLVMRFFNNDSQNAKKLCVFLLENGASLKQENKLQLTPLNQALYYVQNSGTNFALKYNQLMRDGGQGDHMSYPMFDFNEKGGKLEFTALHYAVKQNNFELLINLLKSQEPLDHQIEDASKRIPIELCNSISAIFKTLRRELVKQRYRQVVKNIENIKQQEVDFSNYHKQLLLTLNLTHTFHNSQAARMKLIKKQEKEDSINPNKASINAQNFETEKRKPPTISDEARIRGLKSPPQKKFHPLIKDSTDGNGPLTRHQFTLNKSSQSLLNEGAPRTLPQVFGKKISCMELNKSQRLTTKTLNRKQSAAGASLQMYSDITNNRGVKKLKITLWDRNDPNLKHMNPSKIQHNRERSADMGLKMSQSNQISIFVNNMNNSKQIESKGDKQDRSVQDEAKEQGNTSQKALSKRKLAVDGQINMMRPSTQFTALNRKSSYDLSLSVNKQQRINTFDQPRQTVQIMASQNRELESIHQKFKSINQIKKEQDKIQTFLTDSKRDLNFSNQLQKIRMGNMQRYDQQKSQMNQKIIPMNRRMEIGRNQQNNDQVWKTYKRLMFKSIVLNEDESDPVSSVDSKQSSQNSSDNQKSDSEDEENLSDDEMNENFHQVVLNSQNQGDKNALNRSNTKGGAIQKLTEPPNPFSRNQLNSSLQKQQTVESITQSMDERSKNEQQCQAQQSDNMQFRDTDDLMSYLFDVYDLQRQKQHFQLVEEIEGALLGNKYTEKNQQLETNQNVFSPKIHHDIKQNMREQISQQRSSNVKKTPMTTQTNKEMYNLDISDTEDQQKDLNLLILDQSNQPNKLQSSLNHTQERISYTGADMHDIVDDDVDAGIEPIQNSKTQQNNQCAQTYQNTERKVHRKRSRNQKIFISDNEEDDVDSCISPMVQNKYQVSRKSIGHQSIGASDKSNNKSNCTFPTMQVDEKMQSAAKLSEDSSDILGKDKGGLSIPNFNNNQSIQFQNNNNNAASGKMANLFRRKRQNYLNHDQNTGVGGTQQNTMDPEPRSSCQQQPEVKGRKKQILKKEVEEESIDLGSGTESALLDFQIDLTTQMSMQSIRSLTNIVRKLYQQSQKPGAAQDAFQIQNHDRLQIRQLTDQVSLDVHRMKTAESCLQYKVYIEQLLRIIQKYDNLFVRSITTDIVSAQSFLEHKVKLLMEQTDAADITVAYARSKNVDQMIFQNTFKLF